MKSGHETLRRWGGNMVSKAGPANAKARRNGKAGEQGAGERAPRNEARGRG